MIVAIGVDHAGVQLHAAVVELLNDLGHSVLDLGTRDDYPDIALELGRVIATGHAERGVLICGSGAGVGVAASKVPGIRAQTIHDGYTAHQAVEHDGVNVLCLGSRVIGEEIGRKAEVAKVLARILRALPATFAERQGIDKIPATEQGLLELDAWLDEKKAEVERRQKRIEEIGAEIDLLAWAMYRPTDATTTLAEG